MNYLRYKIALVAMIVLLSGSAYAGGFYDTCARTSSAGGWINYAGGAECGDNWIGWGGNGDSTDRARISTYDAGVRRDMHLTYRHLFAKRATGDTSADHWAYAEGSYSANVPANQQGSGNAEHTVAVRASYNWWDDWLEVGSDGGGSMDTVVEKGKFYPELDAVYAGRSVVTSMYQGNVYQWMYQMSNPSLAWWTWNDDGDRFARVGGVVSGPGWLSSARVAKQPGTGPGGTWTLYFNVRPTQTGSSNEDYQMIRENVSWFGDKVASNGNMRTTVSVSRKHPGTTGGWDNGAKRKGETVRFSVYGSDSWGTGDNYSWDFDGSTNQGWTVANNCTLTPEAGNGRLKIGITGGDPHAVSSGGLAIDCSKANYVSIRMMASGGSTAQFFWSGTAGGWHEARHVDFNIYPDNKWHVYTIKLPASWTGTVHQFRFDPVQSGAANGQTVYVDWIRIHNVNAGMSAKAYLGKVDHNWSIWSEQDTTWDGTNVCWYKDYTIADGYPQTYYHLMHVKNNADQGFGDDPALRFGLYQRAYKVLNTAPTATNNSYLSNGWATTKTPSLGWDYSDIDPNPQSRYQVQVSATANFSNIIADTNLVASASNSYTTPSLSEGQFYYRTRVMDGAYSNLNATYQGGVSLNQAGALSGDSGSKSADFNGTNGYVSLPAGFDSFGGGFTCEFWAYPTAVQSWARFLDMGNGAPADNIVIAREGTTNNIRLYLYRGSESIGTLTGANAISLNTWQHFVATIDTSGWGRIYKNGSLIAQGPLAVPEVVNRSNVYIGRSNWAADTYYKGRLDEFAIYDRCLSAAEISDHYARASQSDSAYRDAVCASGSWTYYRFDETSGTTANAYTGMLSSWSDGTGFRVDTIPPTKPTISSVDINGTTATVTFGGSTDANNFTYEIKLDNNSYISATSPYAFQFLTGSHTVYVRAIDEAGNISEVASDSFTMDSAPPVINSVTSPAATNTSPITVEYNVSDDESGIKEVTLWVKEGSGGVWVATDLTSANATGSFNYAVSNEDTYYFAVVAEDNAENKTPNPTGNGSTATLYDTTDPTADVTLIPESQGAVNFLKGAITIEVEADDIDGSGVNKVEFKVDDGQYIEMTGSNGFYSDDSTEITGAWSNGSHTITVRVTDNAGNYLEVQKGFDVNKNEVSGQIALHGLVLVPISRDVTFVLTYASDGVDHKITRVLTLDFVNNKSTYSFTDLPDGIKSISAKTAWSLRRRIMLTPSNGQCIANFTDNNVVPGGDLPTAGAPFGDNAVNALDYAVLRNAWGYSSIGDITGDGYTDNEDYLAMRESWYKVGDPE